MAHRMPQVERGPATVLERVILDHVDLDTHCLSDHLGIYGRTIRARRPYEREKFRIGDDAVLDQLCHPGTEFRLLQCIQHGGIDDHGQRLFESTDQVLALRQIDARLAAHAGIHHREHGRGDLCERNAAHESRRREACDVARDPAAQGEHHPAAVQPSRQELIIQRVDGCERFVLLAVGDNAAKRPQTRYTKRIFGSLGVEWRDHVVGD